MELTRENLKRLLENNKDTNFYWQIEIVDNRYVISLKDNDEIIYATIDCSNNHISKRLSYYISDEEKKKRIDKCINL